MLVGAHDGPIHIVDVPTEMPIGVSLLLDGGKKSIPEPSLAPAIEAARHRTPWPIPLGEVTPGSPGAQEPADAIEDAAVVDGWPACFRLLRGQKRL